MKYKVKQGVSVEDYSLGGFFVYDVMVSDDSQLENKIRSQKPFTDEDFFNYYISDYLKRIKENITYNPSIDKRKKPRYFNEKGNFHVNLYVKNEYKESEYNSLYFAHFARYECLMDVIKTHCYLLGLYYKIGEINDKTFIIFKSKKDHDIKIVGEILVNCE